MRPFGFGLLVVVALAWIPKMAGAIELGNSTTAVLPASSPVQLVMMPTQPPLADGAFQLASPPATPWAGASASESDGLFNSGFQPVMGIPVSAGLMTINIVPTAALAGNASALAAFQRGAMQWASRIQDPITITINADLRDLTTETGNPNVIGQASSRLLQADYSMIRDALVADAADESDDAIVASLPNAAAFQAAVSTGFSLNGNLTASKANLKALGFGGLDSTFGLSDAEITFNSRFTFDYDNSDGISTEQIDFETVAAHEIGHALGFISGVDDVDWLRFSGSTGSISPYALDLFRFANDQAGMDPANAAEFAAFPRLLASQVEAITDWIDTAWGLGLTGAEARMSTGAYTGDGRQASHWKDNGLTSLLLGIMDPTVAYGAIVPVGEADLRALDLIGYEIAPLLAVPEPQSLVTAALGLLGLVVVHGRAWSLRRRCVVLQTP